MQQKKKLKENFCISSYRVADFISFLDVDGVNMNMDSHSANVTRHETSADFIQGCIMQRYERYLDWAIQITLPILSSLCL